jgi:DNA-binding LacI/PurR family transcriptional regulator/putative methionine-R-sulfoxide reductase with GAF domain
MRFQGTLGLPTLGFVKEGASLNNKKMDNSRRTDSKNGRLTIGLAADDILLVGGRNALLGVADVAQERDLNLICFHQLICQRDKQTPAEMGPAAWDTLMEVMDGLVIYQSWPSQEAFTKFRNRFPNLPMVNALRVHAGCPALAPDFYRGTKELTCHLIEVHGYRRIAFATGPEGWSVEGRYRGYAEALAEHDLPLNPNLVTPYLGWVEAERRAVSILMDERKLRPGTDFEAVVGTNDGIALSVLDELQRRGVRVPNDVAVVGFDDDNRSSCSTPPLTTARLPTYEVGRQAAEILLAQLAGEQVPEQTLVPAQIMIRRSCGCLDPLVAQAAAGSRPTVELLPPSPPATTFNEILTTQRARLLSEMVQAVEDQTGGTVPEWAEQLLSNFAAEIRDEAPGRFVSTLEDVLHQVMAAKGGWGADSGQRVAAWQGAMSALRKNLLPYLNGETFSRAEDLWQQARVAIGKAAYQAYERRTLQVEQQLQILREIEGALITTFNVSELMDVLATGLPRLGISSCYLSLYENPALYQEPQTAPYWSRLMLACAKRGRVELEVEGQRFPSRQLVPAGMLGPDRYSFVVEPLYVRRNQLGFVLFELGPRETNVYGVLRQGISSTLKGALLMEQEERRARQLQTVAEVSTATSTILETAVLLQQVVDLTKERFGLYHAHVYLLNETRDTLHLAAGAGEAGRQMVAEGWHIPLAREQSLVARAARSGEVVMVDNVREAADWLPNPLLPNTYAEMAVPIMLEDKVVGVLDVQEDKIGGLNEGDANLLRSLANHVAVTLTNARLFEETSRSKEEAEQARKEAEQLPTRRWK